MTCFCRIPSRLSHCAICCHQQNNVRNHCSWFLSLLSIRPLRAQLYHPAEPRVSPNRLTAESPATTLGMFVSQYIPVRSWIPRWRQRGIQSWQRQTARYSRLLPPDDVEHFGNEKLWKIRVSSLFSLILTVQQGAEFPVLANQNVSLAREQDLDLSKEFLSESSPEVKRAVQLQWLRFQVRSLRSLKIVNNFSKSRTAAMSSPSSPTMLATASMPAHKKDKWTDSFCKII